MKYLHGCIEAHLQCSDGTLCLVIALEVSSAINTLTLQTLSQCSLVVIRGQKKYLIKSG